MSHVPPLGTKFDCLAGDFLNRWSDFFTLVSRHRGSAGDSPDALLDLFAASVYLRLFAAWEDFLQNVMIFSLINRVPSNVRPSVTPKSTFAHIADPGSAWAAILQEEQKDYLLWHNPEIAIKRYRKFFDKHHGADEMEKHVGKISWYATIRHSIAHETQGEFRSEGVRRMLKGVNVGPGRLLRSSTNTRAAYLSEITTDLREYARLIWP